MFWYNYSEIQIITTFLKNMFISLWPIKYIRNQSVYKSKNVNREKKIIKNNDKKKIETNKYVFNRMQSGCRIFTANVLSTIKIHSILQIDQYFSIFIPYPSNTINFMCCLYIFSTSFIVFECREFLHGENLFQNYNNPSAQ